MNPGVYELDGSSRVFQAIEAAGGFLPEAAASAVNQAQPVSDGQQIYVPTQEEAEEGALPAAIQPAPVTFIVLYTLSILQLPPALIRSLRRTVHNMHQELP